MANFNELTLIGHVGRDAEMKFTPEGKPVANFSVAYSENRGEDDSLTEWFEVETWEKLAETCNQFVSKGMQVMVKGRVLLDRWKDNDNINRSRLKVKAGKVLFLSPKKDGQGVSDGSGSELSF